MIEGDDGRDTDGAGSQGMVAEKGPTPGEQGGFIGGGHDSDGSGSEGMVAEATRVQQGGEGGTTRVGMDGDDTDGAGTVGMAHEEPADGSSDSFNP